MGLLFGRGLPASVVWTQQSVTSPWPAYTGWNQPYYDAQSGQILVLTTIDGASGIYFTDSFSYATLSNTWTHLDGTGQLENLPCYANTSDWPATRHPYWQNAIDTRRNRYVQYSGVCAGTNIKDFWRSSLNADPTTNVWTEIPITTEPNTDNGGAMIYDPDSDVYFLFGTDGGSQTHTHWVFGPTDLNITPGTLTAAQTAAGCATADDWTEVSPVGGVQPGGVAYPGLIYLRAQQKVMLYGGETGSSVTKYNETWWYDVPTKTWTQKAQSTTPPPVYNGANIAWPALAYRQSDGLVFFHQTHNTGAPKTWCYQSSTDMWHALTTTSGPGSGAVMVWDATASRLVTWSQNGGTGKPDIWHGVVS